MNEEIRHKHLPEQLGMSINPALAGDVFLLCKNKTNAIPHLHTE